MSTDWREKEREFLTSLKADTGRDLAEWMRVIAAQNLGHRNDIIDWLRQQGFLFARASWLERIHHNQGRPIYLDPADLIPAAAEGAAQEFVEQKIAAAGGGRTVVAVSADVSPSPASWPGAKQRAGTPPPVTGPSAREMGDSQTEIAAAAPDDAPADGIPNRVARTKADGGPGLDSAPTGTANDQSAAPVRQTEENRSTGDAATPTPVGGAISREDVLARAKAYRPLANYVLGEIELAVAGIAVVPGAGYLMLTREGRSFGLIAVSGKDIRLALLLQQPATGTAPFGPVKLPVTLAKPAQCMTHMAILTDARQVNDDLINLVRAAADG